MIIQITIPEEFEVDFKQDKFSEFFERSLEDMCYLCGNYEKETAVMLKKAFKDAIVVE